MRPCKVARLNSNRASLGNKAAMHRLVLLTSVSRGLAGSHMLRTAPQTRGN
jgi:hypothetical protein